jgi:hypothetical protein
VLASFDSQWPDLNLAGAWFDFLELPAARQHLVYMKKASEYHQHATECRILAARASIDDQRQMLIKMAETWDTLANEREARVAQKQRLHDLTN